jgi:hypothetical protein
MQKVWVLTVSVLAFGTLLAQEPPPKEVVENADRRSKIVENLVAAHRLIAFGKGDLGEASGLKDYQSPEALIAAGGIFLRAQKEAGAFEAVDDNGEVDAKGKTPDLTAQAKELFEEARNLVKGNKARESEINELIAQAQKVDDKRGAVGKPRTVTRVLEPGASTELRIGFVPHCPATIGYTTAGGPKQRCEIINPNGKTIYDNTGREGSHSWRTGGDDVKRMFTIRLTNNGKGQHTVTVTTN